MEIVTDVYSIADKTKNKWPLIPSQSVDCILTALETNYSCSFFDTGVIRLFAILTDFS